MKKLLVLIIALGFLSCEDAVKNMQLISPPEDSGITFTNSIDETNELHYFSFPYIYIGAGGVGGVGDFDNDGLSDIFFLPAILLHPKFIKIKEISSLKTCQKRQV